MTLEVKRANICLIHQEDNFAASPLHSRPAAFSHCLLQRAMTPPHLIRNNQLVCRKDRANLCIQRVQGLSRERLDSRPWMLIVRQMLLGLDQDEDGNMLRMRDRKSV